MTNSRDRENGGLEMDRRGVERNSPLQQERNVMRKKWFESHNFKAEKVVPTGGEVGLYIGTAEGRYLSLLRRFSRGSDQGHPHRKVTRGIGEECLLQKPRRTTCRKNGASASNSRR